MISKMGDEVKKSKSGVVNHIKWSNEKPSSLKIK